MSHINIDQVKKSYNGKSGCMCGCNGNYTLPSDVSIDAANKETGWNAYDESNVSDRRVKIAVRKINEALDQYADRMKDGEFRDGDFSVGRTDKYAWVDTGSRNTAVYFK